MTFKQYVQNLKDINKGFNYSVISKNSFPMFENDGFYFSSNVDYMELELLESEVLEVTETITNVNYNEKTITVKVNY